ncbi:MAG: hypothetical protein QM733_04270 [Ilumatobacteraceae bacterium]
MAATVALVVGTGLVVVIWFGVVVLPATAGTPSNRRLSHTSCPSSRHELRRTSLRSNVIADREAAVA